MPKEDFRIVFQSFTTVSRDYILPRWYVSTPTEEPWIISCTDGVSPQFVEEFTDAVQWKRSEHDFIEPFSLEKRYLE